MYHMNVSLSRLYRPKSFTDVVGQEHITSTLQEQLKSGRSAQVYLFTGIRGVGKTTIARILARALSCRDLKNGEPCNECELCRLHLSNQSPDIIEIDAASNTQVELTRENIIEQVKALPLMSAKKVFIIDEVHMLSKSSFNALLKTLEEPPAHAVFILCTTEVQKIPETVLSRCQRFPFLPLTPDEIALRLEYIAKEEGIKLDADIAKSLVRQAKGSIRDAESLLAQILTFSGKKISWEQARHFLPKSGELVATQILNYMTEGKVEDAFKSLEDYRVNGGVGQAFLESAVLLLRAGILAQVKIEPKGFNDEEKELIKKLTGLEKNKLLFWLKNLVAGWQDSPKVSPEILAAEMSLASCFDASNCQSPTNNLQSAFNPVVAPNNSASLREKSEAIDEAIPMVSETQLRTQNSELITNSDSWSEVVAKIREEHQILGMMLASCKDVEITDTMVVASCPFILYIKEFKKPHHQERIANTIKACLGRALAFEANHKQMEEERTEAMIGQDMPSGGMVPLFS